MNDNYAHRFNIFPTLVYIVDCSDLIEPVKDLLKSVTWNDDWNGQSEDVHILNSEPKLAEEFESRVNLSLSELQYELPLKLSTSWFTKTIPYGSIGRHNHSNSFWSTVYYFDDDCGKLSFTKDVPAINVNFHNQDHSTQMYGEVKFPAKKGHILLFPSSLHHHLEINNFDKERYSLAMNFMPSGMVHSQDSSYHYT